MPTEDLPYTDLLELDRFLPGAHAHAGDPDRMLFLVTHQICELWFAIALGTLTDARQQARSGRALATAARLRRVTAIVEVLITQFDALATLSTEAFAAIRPSLGSASGFQSTQWREIEFLCGLKDPRFVNTRGLSEQERSRLRARLAEPSLNDAIEPLLAQPDLAEAWPRQELRRALVDLDEKVVLWRARHAVLAERFIGGQQGTGGSDGASYLWRAVDKRLFPSAWPGDHSTPVAAESCPMAADQPGEVPAELLGNCLDDRLTG